MTKTLSDQLTDLQQAIEPDADFANQLEQQLQKQHRTMRETTHKPQGTRTNRWTSIAAGLIIITLLVALLPPVQSVAMNILNNLFNRADVNEITTTREQSELLPRDFESVPLDELQSVAGFDVLLPTNIPSAYQLRSSSYFEDRQLISLNYEAPGRGLSIIQQLLSNVEYSLLTDGDFGIGADAPIERVTIGEFSGEYVEGAWIVEDQQVNDEDNTVTTQVIWDEDVSMRTLRWIQDDMIFEIRAMGGSEGYRYIGLDEMIEIALSMQ